MPRPDGKPTIAEIVAELENDPREGKTWPPEEDCPGCDQHRDGPHRFGCSLHGKQQLRVTIALKE